MIVNDVKISREKNQIISQIILPFILLFIILFMGGYILFSSLSAGIRAYDVWKDIALIVICLPLVISFPLILIIFLAAIFFLPLAFQKIHAVFNKVIPLIQRTNRKVIISINRITKLFMEIESFTCRIIKKEK